MLHDVELVSDRPALDGISFQAINPFVDLNGPCSYVACLYIADHGGPSVVGGMMPRLEALDSARRAEVAVEILSLVTVSSDRRRQPLAFDGEERLIFRILTAFDPDNRSTGCYN